MRSRILAVVLISAVTHAARADDRSDKLAKDAPSPLTAPFDAGRAKAAQEAWARHLGKSSPAEKNSIGMVLVLIPPGTFRMGSPKSEKDRGDDEDQVEVTLTKGFLMGKTEVTQGQWRAVMGTAPWNGQEFAKDGDNYAATFVSWDNAQAFCKKLSQKENGAYRLPTEAEWEYACRGGTTTRFSFGDDESKLSDCAWWGGVFDKDNTKDEQYAHEVGRKKANPFGLHDIHGNVWEWCEDVYADPLLGGTDPLSARGVGQVYRGGDWGTTAAHCRSAFRLGDSSRSSQLFNVGFRVARSSAP